MLLCVCVCLHAANGSDSKKQRLDEAPPSKVLHIRKLPNEVSETEVIALGLPFGKVTNILMLKGKNQVPFNTDCNYWPLIKVEKFSVNNLFLCRRFWSWAQRKQPLLWWTTTQLSHHRYETHLCPCGLDIICDILHLCELYVDWVCFLCRSETHLFSSSTPTTRSWKQTRLLIRYMPTHTQTHTLYML